LGLFQTPANQSRYGTGLAASGVAQNGKVTAEQSVRIDPHFRVAGQGTGADLYTPSFP
jgi:hypothetical protein